MALINCKPCYFIFLCLIGSFGLPLGSCDVAFSLDITPSNVQAIGVYGAQLDSTVVLPSNNIVYNIADSSTISSLLASIEFSNERDCSRLGALYDAIVYIKFKDNSVEVYNLFGRWTLISKAGIWGSCYRVSSAGQSILKNNAQ